MIDKDLLTSALEKYCEWLNGWLDADRLGPDDTFAYTPELFLKPQHGSYVRAIIPIGSSAAFDRLLMEARVYDGDDGGPTDLTVWFEVEQDGVYRPTAIVQGFDTNLQFIMEDGGFKNLP